MNVFEDRPSLHRSSFRPPKLHEGHTARPRLNEFISEQLSNYQVLVVSAPSGYGKTTAVTDWAQSNIHRVAWLTLGRLDDNAMRIDTRILQALQSRARDELNADLLELSEVQFGACDLAAKYDHIVAALEFAAEPITLVIDDCQQANDQINEGLLGAMLELPIHNLHIILIGTKLTEFALSRTMLHNPSAALRAQQLAFTLEEIESVAQVDHTTAQRMFQQTNGWPIAVKVFHLANIEPNADSYDADRLFTEYFQNHLLKSLSDDLAKLALETSICEVVTPELAEGITGLSNARELLSQADDMELFINRYESTSGIVYRWHSVFADRARAVLESQQPGAVRQAYAKAAKITELQFSAIEAAIYWVKAGEINEAIDVICVHWVEILISSDAVALDNLLSGLPHPYNDDARALLIRATIQEVLGSHETAHSLHFRALRISESSPESHKIHKVQIFADLLLLNDRNELSQAADTLLNALEDPETVPASARPSAMFLIGFALLRNRSNPELMVNMLTSAANEARARGLLALADRSLSSLAAGLAWAGQMAKAREVLEQRTIAADAPYWVSYVGGADAVALSQIHYWANELEQAKASAESAMTPTNSPFMFSGVARLIYALIAAAQRDTEMCKRATDVIESMPDTDERGINWTAWRHLALALLHEVAGKRETAVKIITHYQTVDNLPFLSVLFASLAMRYEMTDLAVSLIRNINKRYASIPYVIVALGAFEAVQLKKQGMTEAALQRIEETLPLAVTEDLKRIYAGSGLQLRQLIIDYISADLPNAGFLSDCISAQSSSGPLASLSDREREVLIEMRTSKSVQEIADHLGVSANTVKTHQRSIYRKLGVPTRREAIRFVE